tara:strand:- start:102 stop:959 length:858 start_codon:yes stop_codon:yes gene_type:complete
MIFWIASYPKSGNTWLRTLLSTYYYSSDGVYDEKLLKNIDQFPTKKYLLNFEYNKKIVGDTCKHWIRSQEKINIDKKLRFFKTHNAFGKVNNFDFTNSENSIGCLYIVRDPRNVFTSVKNHYELDTDKAMKWMTNEKQFIYDVQNFDDVGFSDFQFISSWSLNYKSWKVQKKVPTKFIRYEDLSEKTFSLFKEIIQFINKITNNNEKIDLSKLKKALNSTTFEKLKEKEKTDGFSEAIPSKKDKNKKIPFFNLGPKNNWKNLLDEDLKLKLNNLFKKDLKDLSYN